MSLPKSFWISIVFVLFVINIIFSILLLRREPQIEQIESQYDYKLVNLKRICELQATISANDIEKVICTYPYKYNCYDLCVFVPPFPCGDCITEQFFLIQDYLTSNQNRKIFILVSQERLRDTKAAFSGYNNVTIMPYQTDHLDDSELTYIDGLIFFYYDDGKVLDIFISNKIFPELTTKYLSKISMRN